ncbi:hypothetical protein [Streptomyces chartreusis]|uniref:hypothetical protein n=1 Tax=Streptomyces chartreusis TaxID=1969 RepID=UPI0036504EA2
MQVVGVHGIGNYRPGATAADAARHLSDVWTGALPAQLASELTLDVAYYADLLQHQGRQGGGSTLADLDPFELQLVEQWVVALSPPQGVATGWGTKPLRQYLAWVSEVRGVGKPLTEWFVTRFFKEVAAYLRGPDNTARVSARQRVIEALEQLRPEVVVAHSLGSVVAYEALWSRPDIGVKLLVTLGSPLAMPHAVYDRLLPSPAEQPAGRPPGVGRWVNLADPGDLVAIPEKGMGVAFSGVDVDRHTLIDAFDFHKVRNYLSARQVVATLSSHLNDR